MEELGTYHFYRQITIIGYGTGRENTVGVDSRNGIININIRTGAAGYTVIGNIRSGNGFWSRRSIEGNTESLLSANQRKVGG